MLHFNHRLIFLVDTGASLSLIKHESIGRALIDEKETVNVLGISGKPFRTLGSVKLKLKAKNFKSTLTLQVLPQGNSLRVDGILGADFLKQYSVDVCFSTMSLLIKKCNARLPLLRADTVSSQTLPPCSLCYVDIVTRHTDTVCINTKKLKDDVYLIGCIQKPRENVLTLVFENNTFHSWHVDELKLDFERFDDNAYKVNFLHSCSDNFCTVGKVSDFNVDNDESTTQLMNKIFSEYDDLMATKDDTRPAQVPSQSIFLKPYTVPRYIKQYRLPPSYREIISSKVKKMVDQDFAEPSVSQWNAPVLLVPKKGAKTANDYRLVIDYRRLNDVVEDDKFPIPDINEILDGLGKAKYFSTIDLDQGYYQIPLDKQSRPYTAFSTDDGHFQLTRLPMGLKVSPAIFSRLMRMIFGDLIGRICYVYLDDIIVYGSTKREHAKNLRLVFERLRQMQLRINFKKCQFFQNSVSFLGHVVSGEGLKPDPTKYETIKKWPVPTTVQEVQSFLGLTNYYRRFVKNFANVARPLYALTKKDVPFYWSSDCEKSFEFLKSAVITPPTLSFPDFSKPFLVQTDASEDGLGAVLMNYDKRPVAFLSKTLNKTQQAYHITDKELLAIVFALKKWSNYLLGQKFIVQTDHKALEELFKMKEPTSRLTRYRLLIEQYDFEIHYLKGKKNVVADALSRVRFHIDDLKNMQVNVVTRFQQRKLNEAKEKPEETQASENDDLSTPIVTRLLRKQVDVPLLEGAT